jgi:hypothetical protein
MSLRISLEDVTPTRLLEAREVVVATHPGTAGARAPMPPEALPDLRRRVAEVAESPEALATLARELSPREVRGLVTGLEQWEELRPPVAALLMLRARIDLVGALWRAWQRFPTVEAVGGVLVKLAEQFGWETAVGTTYSPVVPAWVPAEHPGRAIQQWLDGMGNSFSDLSSLRGLPLLVDAPLARLVRDAVLTDGSLGQLRAEGGPRLLQWYKELRPEDRLRFGRNYLTRVPVNEWYRPIIDELERTFGLPRRPRMAGFWEEVPEEPKRAFQRIFVGERLEQAFHDDTDRYDYWARWVDVFNDVELSRAGETDYAILYFDRFAVVEFFEVGHAAHFYDFARLQRLTRARPRNPADLKEQFQPVFGSKDNRLIHNPPGRWYNKADLMVRRWMRSD